MSGVYAAGMEAVVTTVLGSTNVFSELPVLLERVKSVDTDGLLALTKPLWQKLRDAFVECSSCPLISPAECTVTMSIIHSISGKMPAARKFFSDGLELSRLLKCLMPRSADAALCEAAFQLCTLPITKGLID